MEKSEALRAYLRDLGAVAVAFSGGTDSAYLLAAAHETLGQDCIALTACSPTMPRRERDEAAAFCAERGIRQIIFESGEVSDPRYAVNPPDRCYICKHIIFSRMQEIACEQGFSHLVEGSNTDDEGDYRPGMRAITELGILSPLRICGLSKADIRAYSHEMELPTWDKPSAACLASRFAYGERITLEGLAAVERGEALLHDLGLRQVRVRVHGGNLARIEVPETGLENVLVSRDVILSALYESGFAYVTLDLQGYRTGSMNETLKGNI